MDEKSLKEIMGLTLKLFVICFVVAGLLAFVNSITKPIIEKNDKKVFEESMAEVLPDAADFEDITKTVDKIQGEGVTLEGLYKADNGYVANVICAEGYGGDVNVMIGIDNDNKITKIKILSMNETAGLGAKASEEKFTKQYEGLTNNIAVEKNNGGNPDDNTISAISGATVTSKAVTKAVNFAVDTVTGGGADE